MHATINLSNSVHYNHLALICLTGWRTKHQQILIYLCISIIPIMILIIWKYHVMQVIPHMLALLAVCVMLQNAICTEIERHYDAISSYEHTVGFAYPKRPYTLPLHWWKSCPYEAAILQNYVPRHYTQRLQIASHCHLRDKGTMCFYSFLQPYIKVCTNYTCYCGSL